MRPDKQRSVIQVRKFPRLRRLAKLLLIASFIMMVSAFFIPTFQTALSASNLETPTITLSPTETPIPPTSTLTPTMPPTPTRTATATVTSTFTPTPSFTPSLTATATTNPMVFRGLDQQCLRSNLWSPFFYNGENKVVDSRNCWDFEGWGIFSTVGGLKFDVTDVLIRQDITRRFYTEIKGDTEIRFSIFIKQFTTRQGFDGVLMLGVGNPDSVLDSGYFIKYSVLGKDGKIRRSVSPNLITFYEPTSVYLPKEKQNIIIRITGDQVKIIADGNLLGTHTLPAEDHSVFWIVYSLPSNNGSLYAEISDFQLYDHR